ncbi:MAG: hypothetical protein B7Z35_12330 [Hydrogenophilales bacterium 12-61-10]|nr:MAG: hypothetical protein B7Z35_12330 [Hydrogenophilales bacterium 12-61-10]OYX28732.1 MAG: hypothetical protein B7Z03_11010 [Hydrogenophilales bacterium 32-62-9]
MNHVRLRRSLIAMFSIVLPLAAPPALAEQAVDPVDLGALYVNGAMTLDASTPVFRFTTFELAPGSTLSFGNLTATDTLQLSASQSIRLFGELLAAPAGSLTLEAPWVEIGEGGLVRLPGGSVTLSAVRDVDASRLLGEPVAGGMLTVSAGGSIQVAGTNNVRPLEPILVGGGGSVQVSGDGLVTLQAPVPEPESWTMLLAGLGLIGWAVARRNRNGER